MRLKIIRFFTIGLFIFILAGLFYIQVIQGRYFYRLSMNNRIRAVSLEGWRGRIKDRNGKILADNRLAYNAVIIPQDIADADKLFSFLSQISGMKKKLIIRKYHHKKFTPFTPVFVLEDISREKAIIIEENKYRFPSLSIQESFKRVYPLGKNSAHVLGYVGKINKAKKNRYKEYGYSLQSVVGYLGVEEYYDDYLKGENGGYQIEVNSRGKQVRLLSLKEPTKGVDIELTIDSDVQKISLDLLEEKTGVIVLMDMDNGEILGMTSTPTFDPNIFVDKKKYKKSASALKKLSSPLFNRAIRGTFPPGSVFKIPVSIAALDSKKITMQTSYICRGVYKLGGIEFGCTHKHGSQNLVEAIAHSCNIYYYHVGQKLGSEMIGDYAKRLGLGELTQIDLPYERSGNIPSRRKRLLSGRRQWYAGDTLNFSIGQGDVLTTPIQLVKMMATVAREGYVVQPHIIKLIGGKKVNQYSIEEQLKIKPKIFKIVKKGLRATVTDYSGTAHALDLRELYVAGKTGTAQTSGGQADHAWFVGYAKGDIRNIAFCVFLEHGGSSYNAVLLSRQLLLKLKQAKVL